MSEKKMGTLISWFAFAVIGLLVLALGPCSLSLSVERARRISCSGNLKQIGLGLKMYAGDHAGLYPSKLRDIAKYVAYQPLPFVCPSTRNRPGDFGTVDGWTDYIYIPALPASVPPNTVMMYCPAENHGGEGGNVLFADGHVEWFNGDRTTREGIVEPSLDDIVGTIDKVKE